MKTKNNKGIWKYLYCDIYEVDIFLYVGDYKQYKKYHPTQRKLGKFRKEILNSLENLIDENCPLCINTSYKSKPYIFIFLNKYNKNNITDVCTLLHECVHAAVYIVDDKEMLLPKTNNEVLAYTTEWIFKNFYKTKKKKVK